MKHNLFYLVVAAALLTTGLSSCNKSDKVSVNNVTFNHAAAILIPGGNITLTATVMPNDATNKALTWSSDNEAVAKVSSDGVVTAVSKGIAKITAKANGKEATCEVTVTSNQMIMKTGAIGAVTIGLAGEGSVTIDWGNGEMETHMLSSNLTYHARIFTGEGTHAITITGDITEMRCQYNQLTELDVSGNPALIELSCGNNLLTTLDVSKNTALTYLSCRDNQLTSLNVKGLSLITLFCQNNRLKNLDLDDSILLWQLNCSNNELQTLDLNKCRYINILICSHNRLTSLNMNECKMLTSIDCSYNRLASLNVSDKTELHTINLAYNRLHTTAIDSLFGTLHGNTLTESKKIDVSDNQGSLSCNTSIANNKGWTVIAD